MRRFMPSWFHDHVLALLDILYPQACCSCGCTIGGNVRHICCECWNGLIRVDPSIPVWQELQARVCASGEVRDIASCFLFEKEGGLQKLIHGLKYEGKTSIGMMLGREVGLRVRDFDLHEEALVASVPLHRLKLRERGYNQSDFICRGIEEVTGIPFRPGLLQRTRYTESQTHLHMHERRINVARAFRVAKSKRRLICGKTVLIVDDVITTGATIQECAAVLRQEGASGVVAVSVALAS